MNKSNISHSILLQAIYDHAVTTPLKTALIEDDIYVNYKELAEKIELTASYLLTIGLKKNDYIILGARKELEFVYLYLAAHMLGIINVVVDQATTTEKLEYITNIINPKIAFGLQKISADGVLSVSFSDINFEKNVNGSISLENVLSNSKMSKDDTADIMFTTGTTGNPKGVCLSHYNIASSALNINNFIQNTSDDIEVLCLPLSHSFGLGRLRCNLIKGAELILVGNFANLKVFFNVIETYHVTGFGMVPAVWEYIRKLSGARIAKYASQIHYIEIGSAPMPIFEKKNLINLFPDSRICMHYGLTEASRSFFMEFHEYKNNLESIGKPVSENVQIRICDDNGNEVETGQQGEICVKGNMVMNHYFFDTDTKSAFWNDYFRTGDYGYKDNNGCYYMVGRKKELINIGGKKVSPLTIEDAIKSLGVEDCACIPIADPKNVLGEVPKVFIQEKGCNLSFEEIKSKLINILEPFEIPVEFEWIDKIPKTSSGKIQRLSLLGK